MFILVLVMLEAGARILTPAAEPLPQPPKSWVVVPEEQWIEFHPKLGWFHKKNKNAHWVKNGLGIPLSTNSLGLRGKREYPLESTGKKRIYAVGDSFTFGFGVRDEETFAAQMEILDPSLDVLNLGVAGYGIDQMALLQEDFGYAYKPAATFIAVYPEDFWRATRSYTDAGYGKPYFTLHGTGRLKLRQVPVPQLRSYHGSQFFDLTPEENIVFTLFHHSALVKLFEKLYMRLLKMAGLEDPESGREWILGRQILKRMFETARQNGSEPVLVIVPPIRWVTGTVEPVRDSMLRLARKNGVRCVDLTPVFQEALKRSPADNWYIPDDFHWTPEGHALVAQTLIDFLKNS